MSSFAGGGAFDRAAGTGRAAATDVPERLSVRARVLRQRRHLNFMDTIAMPPTHSRGSALADVSAAQQALDFVMPMIQAGVDTRRVGESGFLYIVIMDPGLRSGECRFEDAVLYEHAIGDRSTWDADYAQYAREKARVCWEHQRTGHSVRSCSPHLLRKDETGVWGGVWLDGIAVGVSGADPWFDEAIGFSVAAALRAIAKQRALQRPESLWISDQ